MCEYEVVKNVIFLENFAYVLNEWSLTVLQYCIITNTEDFIISSTSLASNPCQVISNVTF